MGALRTNTDDCRNILERASAREAARVAAAGIAREFLAELGVDIMSYVVSVGDAVMHEDDPMAQAASLHAARDRALGHALPRSCCHRGHERGREGGRACRREPRWHVPRRRDGAFARLGTYASGPDRLTARIGGALFSIPAIKGVEFGLGFEATRRPGSRVHDPIVLEDGEFRRSTNNAGGLEGA